MGARVSVIVPVYNVKAYLRRCIRSIQNQTLKELQIILVDDGSTDGSSELCDRCAAEDSRITVVHQKNQGAGIARNSGLELADGDYIGFVDSDDYVEETMYERMVSAAQRYQADMVLSGIKHIGGIYHVEEKEKESYCFPRTEIFETEEEREELLLGMVGSRPGETEDSRYGFSASKNLYRTQVIKETGLRFISERTFISEDLLFQMDFLSRSRRAVGIPGAPYCYCRNGESLTKRYRGDRFFHNKRLVEELERRLLLIMKRERFQTYLDRRMQTYARIGVVQEISYAKANGISAGELRRRIRTICGDKKVQESLRRYPWRTLPPKQAVFAFAMKYRMTGLLKLLVYLRKRG